MQFNFSRIIMTLLKLTPVTEIQIKFGQSCKDDGWILFILSDGGLAGRVAHREGERGPQSVLCLNLTVCQLLGEATRSCQRSDEHRLRTDLWY